MRDVHIIQLSGRPLLSWAAALSICACGGSPGSSAATAGDLAEADAPPTSITNSGVAIDYADCGTADTTLVFVHGWAIDRGYWSHQVDEFCPQYRVVTIDLPGQGSSGQNRSGWAVEDYAGDVRAVMDQLHLTNVILIGHSMGGNIILEAALGNDNVLALVGADNFKTVHVEYTDGMEVRIRAFVEALRTDYEATALAFTRRGLFQPTTDSAVVQRVLQSVTQMEPEVSAATMAGVFAYAPTVAERMSRLRPPLYLINSSASPTDSVGLRSTGITVEVLDVGPTGHYPMVEKPEAFDELLRQVLRSVAAGTRD